MKIKLLFRFVAGGAISASLFAHAFGCIVDDNKTSSHHATGTGGAGGASGPSGPTSGPGAGGAGGSNNTPLNCAVFCSGMTTTCVGADTMYGDEAQCYATCSLLTLGMPGDTSGNTLTCRNHYLALAKQSGQNADVYCINAGPGSAGACGTNCDNFCFFAGRLCTGKNQQWPNTSACLADCKAFPNSESYNSASRGDQFACRLYYLTVASEKPDEACADIAKTSMTCFDPVDAGPDDGGDSGMKMDAGKMDSGSDSGDGG